MRVRVRGTLTRAKYRNKGIRSSGHGPKCIRLLPFLCIFIIVAALGILAVSEMSLMGKRVVPTVMGGGGAASRIMPGRVRHHSSQPKPPPQGTGGIAFKIEPLLRRNAISIELYAQSTVNHLRAAIIKSYITKETAFMPKKIKDERTCSPPPGDCPPVPPALYGVVNVTSWLKRSQDSEELEGGKWLSVNPGGWSAPEGCTSRHVIALVIPYRDRSKQLVTLMHYLHPLLQRQQLNYKIFVVEQAGNDTFNKGVLMNAGFLTALKHPIYPGVIYHCFIFHDVDMLPEDDRNIYSCPQQPRHMSVAVNELNYKLPYRQLVGGVFAIRSDHFFRVNGYSNLYWGWGGEDDDMGYRVEHVLSSISRPPEWIARYTMLKHEKRKPLAWKVRIKLLRTSWRRYRLDGLNTVQYNLLRVKETPLYTYLLVDVGQPPQNIKVIQQEQDEKAERNDR